VTGKPPRREFRMVRQSDGSGRKQGPGGGGPPEWPIPGNWSIREQGTQGKSKKVQGLYDAAKERSQRKKTEKNRFREPIL